MPRCSQPLIGQGYPKKFWNFKIPAGGWSANNAKDDNGDATGFGYLSGVGGHTK